MAAGDEHGCSRRDFLRSGAAWGTALLASLATACSQQGRSSVPPIHAPPTRILGGTGQRVSILGLGGQAVIERPDLEGVAVPIIERALELGINYFDTAAAYGGETRCSERYLGRAIGSQRDKVFLATKTNDRSRDGSLRLLERSLQLLKTDHVDLWQIHNLWNLPQLDQVFGPGGVIEALVQAREQKLVRFLGVTGHADPAVLVEAIRRFPFDTVLMAVNAADKQRLSFIERLLPFVVERNMGIIAMKVVGNGRLVYNWRQLAHLSRPGPLTMQEALHYVLTLPVHTAIVGCNSVGQLEQNVRLAAAFASLTPIEMAAIEARAKPVAREALYFRNWS